LRGYQKAGIPRAVREAGGEIFAITSEPQTLATEAEASWELEFSAVGDPHHEIADACRERGWLHLFVHDAADHVAKSFAAAAHPRGYFQPGVLALTREGRVLYRWRSRPTRKNMGGAAERPVAQDVWDKVEAALSTGEDAGDAPLDVPERYDMRGIPWPWFVTLLLANGNFLRPRPFPLVRGGPDDVNVRARRALRRIPLFVGAWIAGFVFLPTWLVLLALAGWCALVARPLIELHGQFQNVRSGEPDVDAARRESPSP
jgi:hypothetical protein